MILIDSPLWAAKGRVWSHLASDTSYEELHAFAAHVGLHPRSYDGDHYDVPSERYDEVVAAGAAPTSARVILARVEAAGLRFRKRRGERPLAALPNGLPFLNVDHRLDLLASAQEPPVDTTVATVTFISDTLGRFLLIEAAHRGGWESPGGWREPGESPRAAAVREVSEETGLALEETALVPCAYERILLSRLPEAGPGAGRLLPMSHIAVYRTRIEGVGKQAVGKQAVGMQEVNSAGSRGPEGHRLRWAHLEQMRGICGAAPWWPLMETVAHSAS